MKSRRSLLVVALTALVLTMLAGPAVAQNGGGGRIPIDDGRGGYGGSFGNGPSAQTICSGGGAYVRGGGLRFWESYGC